jgi:hypothetical protein
MPLELTVTTILLKLLIKKGLHVQRQVSIPIEFGGELMKTGIVRIINGVID